MIKNTYLDIAENDLQYLESVIAMGNTFYNQLAVQCQQVAEKYLKGYLDKIFVKGKNLTLISFYILIRYLLMRT